MTCLRIYTFENLLHYLLFDVVGIIACVSGHQSAWVINELYKLRLVSLASESHRNNNDVITLQWLDCLGYFIVFAVRCLVRNNYQDFFSIESPFP